MNAIPINPNISQKAVTSATSTCSSCGIELEDNEFWQVTRYIKKLAKIPCKKCGGNIEIAFNPAREAWNINKACTCPLELTELGLDSIRNYSPWEKKYYYYCSKCFEEHPLKKNIVMTEVLKTP